MRIGPFLLPLVPLLSAQDSKPAAKTPPASPALRLQAQARCLSPQEMLRSMVALDQARQAQTDATVEVIGYDDEAALKLLAVQVRDQVRLGFQRLDKHGHKALYAFMHQDPSCPGPVLLVPLPAGAKPLRDEDKWLK